MSKGSNIVFKVLIILVWLIFVGLSIEAVGLLVNFIVSIYNPEFVPNLYQKLDLLDVYRKSTGAFLIVYSFALTISFLKVFLFWLLIRLVHRLDLSKPFNRTVSAQIAMLSYCTFSIGMLSYLARQTVSNLQHRGFGLEVLSQFWVDSEAFILMAAVIYVIAAIFAKGVEIQNENELTV